MESAFLGTGFDMLFGGLAVICGIMCITGHGEIFLGRNARRGSEESPFDEQKVLYYSGLFVLLIGIGSFAFSFLKAYIPFFEVVYLIYVVAMVAGMAISIQLKAKKKPEQLEAERRERLRRHQEKNRTIYHGGTKKVKKTTVKKTEGQAIEEKKDDEA